MGHQIVNTININKALKVYLYGMVLLILGLLVSLSSYLNVSVFAVNTNNDQVTVSLPVSCTISGSNNTHTESLVNNTYDSSIGNGVTTLTTYCNDNNGYIIYAIGNSNNTEGNTNLVGDLVAGGNVIATGTAVSGDTSNWAFEIGSLDSSLTMNSVYNNGPAAIPSSWAWVAKKESNTTDMSSGSKITANYSIYINGTQAAGTYTGQVKYVMLHPSTAAHPTDTLEHAFALAGKTKIDHILDPETGEYGSYYAMQDMNTNICESTTLVDSQNTLKLVDTRDNKLYYVTKLQDGHCWMTQNLDLDLAHTTTLTSNDTDLNDNTLSGAYQVNYKYEDGVIKWTPQNTTRNYAAGTGAWSSSNNIAYSLDPGDWYWNANDDTPTCNYLTTTCADFSQTPYSNNGNHGHVGNYYNWSAAIASDSTSGLTTDTRSDTNKTPKNSICPKGWKLPYFGSIGTLNTLYNSGVNYSDQRLVGNPLYLVRAGSYQSGNTITDSGKRGDYWYNNVRSNGYAYGTIFSRNEVKTDYVFNSSYTINERYSKNLGKNIRCLAR